MNYINVVLLKYRDTSASKWFAQIKTDKKYVIIKDKIYYYTLDGLKYAEFKQVVRNKKIKESNSGVYII